MDDRVPGCMVRWFVSFLNDREAQARVGEGTEKWRLQQGLPQGPLAPRCCSCCMPMNGRSYRGKGVEYAGFADALAIWATGRRVDAVKERVQAVLHDVDVWEERNKILLNPA